MMFRMKVTLNNKKVFYSQSAEENEEATSAIETIKNIGNMSFFWMIDNKGNVVSFNVNSLATIEVLPVKKYWLF